MIVPAFTCDVCGFAAQWCSPGQWVSHPDRSVCNLRTGRLMQPPQSLGHDWHPGNFPKGKTTFLSWKCIECGQLAQLGQPNRQHCTAGLVSRRAA